MLLGLLGLQLGPRLSNIWHTSTTICPLQGNDNGVRAVVFRLPPFVYTKDFSFFYDVMYKAAEKKGSSSYVGEGKQSQLLLNCLD